ncbi:hypothetical protein [Mycoplasma alkalescens]|uniref:Uncharacterized protein n=1 Tax=Metamycoplasma alkalescens 14918 TaxID=1188234 RepID=N9UB14_9BACT|nr:Hypothetical protein, predicted transmembrane protein [Metamycoplasma alkalescens 14918]
MENSRKLRNFAIAYLSLFFINIAIIIILVSASLFSAGIILNGSKPDSLLNLAIGGNITVALISYLLIIPISIAMVVLLIWSAIIAPNQKYLVLFIVGNIFWIVAIVGMIMYLVESKRSNFYQNTYSDNITI